MKIFNQLAMLAGVFAASHEMHNVDEKTPTDRNPHKLTKFEVAPGFFINAINKESAMAQYEKIMKKKNRKL